MERFCLLCHPSLLVVFLLAFLFASVCRAAETTRALTVRESGAALYSQQEVESDKITTLQEGETLVPLAEAVGQETWYMVKTARGLIGWVRAADTSGEAQLRETFKETSQRSTWSAIATGGRIFEGNWTVETANSADKAFGTWTLGEGLDKTFLRGTWSAQKFSTGWSGTWRATVEGQKREFTGSWTADFPQGREASIGELFSKVAGDAIRGIWSADNDSGSWIIRATKQ